MNIFFFSRSLSLQSDISETDGENDDNKTLEMGGIKYPHKSWFFVYHSTTEGMRWVYMVIMVIHCF